jgi:succinate-semialdehyde dehydrogenase/glutarate-semialdehyde dehydrogenase
MATETAPATRLARRVAGAGADRAEMMIRSPVTGAPIAAVPRCSPDDVTAAVAAARTAQWRWRRVPVAERARILLRFHDAVLDRREELLDLIQRENGKDRLSALEEVLDVAIVTRHYARTAARMLRPRRRRGALPGLTVTVEHRRPKGVVGIITPWNYPLMLPVSDSVPALLAGNAVVVKPASETTLSVLCAAELLDAAGLPPGLFAVVTGQAQSWDRPGRPGRLRCSPAARWSGAPSRNGARAGSSGSRPSWAARTPPSSWPTDLPKAVEGLVRACFANSGQMCVSMERIYVERAIAKRFIDMFGERVRRMRLGGEIGYGPELGSLTSAGQLEKVTAHVRDATAKGADRRRGRACPDLGPWFFEPTVPRASPKHAVARGDLRAGGRGIRRGCRRGDRARQRQPVRTQR